MHVGLAFTAPLVAVHSEWRKMRCFCPATGLQRQTDLRVHHDRFNPSCQAVWAGTEAWAVWAVTEAWAVAVKFERSKGFASE